MAPGNGEKVVHVFEMEGIEICSDLAPYPIDPQRAGGGLLDNNPVLCGGNNFDTECYAYNKASNTWQLHANLVKGRHLFAAAIFKEALWVTGGYGGGRLDSTEIIATDGTVTAGPTLPDTRHGHCMVVLNDDEFMILGSKEADKNTLIYNVNSGAFTNGPSMIHARRRGTCSVFQSKFHNGRQVLLVAGGMGQITTELLDFSQENAQWEEGMNFRDMI